MVGGWLLENPTTSALYGLAVSLYERIGQPMKAVTIREKFESYLAGLESKSESTRVRYRQIIGEFLSSLGDRVKRNLTALSSFLVTANDAVNDNAAINLGGGTMALNGNVGEVVGQLKLSANSTLDMGTGNSWVSFAGLGALLDNATRLNVYNYTPR